MHGHTFGVVDQSACSVGIEEDGMSHNSDAASTPTDHGKDPDSPRDLHKRSWWAVLRRTFAEFRDDNLTDRAAALTYYGVLAIFPMLLVLVSILGLLGKSTTQSLIDNLGQIAPGGVRSFFENIITSAQKQRGAAGLTAIIGLLVALWSASGYVAAFMRTSNEVYEIGEGRPIWKTAPIRLAVTVAIVLMLALCAAIVVLTGRVAEQVGRMLGIGHTAVTAWSIAKWPVLLIIVALMLALLYWASPNVKGPGWRWISPGSGLAVLIWLIASGAFAVYAANFASYNKTYGSVAGVILFLVWLWITNIAVLLGIEFDAELERERAIVAGVPEDAQPYVVPRDTRKLDDDETLRAEQSAQFRDESTS
jgi:membrane protein